MVDVPLSSLPGVVFEDADFTGGHWFECAPAWPSAAKARGGTASTSPSIWVAAAAEAHAAATAAHEARLASVAGSHRARRQLLEAAASGGTARDRIAARALRVQQSPVHRLEDIRALVTAAAKVQASHSSMTTALDAAADLFVQTCCHPTGGFGRLRQCPLGRRRGGVAQAGTWPRRAGA